jgi:hypothetical protein
MINFIRAVLQYLNPDKEDKLMDLWMYQYRIGVTTHNLDHLDAQDFADEQYRKLTKRV